eukprot:scaffold197191_cov31-Attheya_sp.AAC.1
MAPWREVADDLIGPWKVKIGHLPVVNEAEAYVTFNALTCIDPVTKKMKRPFTSNTFRTTASKEMAGIEPGTTDSKSEANTNYATIDP